MKVFRSEVRVNLPPECSYASFGKRTVIVVEARIESRFWTHDTRAFIFKLLASIQASSPLNNILSDPKTDFLTLIQKLFSFLTSGHMAMNNYKN